MVLFVLFKAVVSTVTAKQQESLDEQPFKGTFFVQLSIYVVSKMHRPHMAHPADPTFMSM